MQKRQLGRGGLTVSAIGLGCMGMSEFYGPHSEAQSLKTLQYAVDQGINFWDTSDMYGPETNERLLGQALKSNREAVVLATKFGIERSADGEFAGINGSPEHVRKACDASLQRLGTDFIDLYYQHRVDPGTPIEETVGAMAELVTEGKVRYLGLSEASSQTLRRASAIHPIAALQTEYSLWSRDVEGDILPTCRELGIGLVPYSPLGRGFLSGKIRSLDDLAEDDWRRNNPRFTAENLAQNLKLLDVLSDIAAELSCSNAQLALAWLLAQGDDVVPIPGTRSIERLKENAGAAELQLTPEQVDTISKALPPNAAHGERYPPPAMALLNA